MKRSWLVFVAVIALGGLAGVAIAGRPTPVDTLVISPPSSTVVTTSTAVATTTTAAPATSAPTTSSVASSTTSTTSPPLDPAEVRVLVANGSDRPGIASATAALLIDLGYPQASAVDALDPADATVVYFQPGFGAEAAAVAVALDLTADRIAPLTAEPVTPDDGLGDVIVVLGADSLG